MKTIKHPPAERAQWMEAYRLTGSVRETCKQFSISRKTFYKWLKRFREAKGDGISLCDQSKRPKRFPKATPPETVALVLKLRRDEGLGQRRIKSQLAAQGISISERTIWKILKNHGVIPPQT